MVILFIHNYYQQPGGEDAVVAAEARLLEEHGHRVVGYERHNDELRGGGLVGAIAAGIGTVWAVRSFRDIKKLLAKEKPDIVHFHNTFPLISPAAYYACAGAGVPVVQTLHNYRMLCPAATLLRDSKVCESCLGRSVAWPGVVHGCYRKSRTATALVATMSSIHRAIRTWKTKVDLYIALSEFARSKFLAGGLPSERIFVKPNFALRDPGPGRKPAVSVLYVGRLSEEKGIRVLLDAWRQLEEPIPLRIAGDGPLHTDIKLRIKSATRSDAQLMGRISPADVHEQMRSAHFLVQPSVCFENFPLTIAEAFACGVPVIASRLGSMAEIVRDGVTGLHFEAGNAADLAAKVEWAWNHPEEMARMGRAALAEYEAKYTPEINYKILMQIYQRATEQRNNSRQVAQPVQ